MAPVTVRRIGATVELTIPQIPLANRDQARASLTEDARTFLALALEVLRGFIADAAPVGVSGHLGQSIAAGPVVGQSLEDLSGTVFSDLLYAVAIDQGRQPGARMPPSEALIPWVEKVLGVGGSPSEIRQVAFLVARSIGRKGIVARHFFDKGYDAAGAQLDGLWSAMGAAMTAHLAGAGSVTPGAGGVGI